MKEETVNELSKKVLKRIVTRRNELGISQWDMSEKLNLTNNGYFKVETGLTKLDTKRLIRIANVLDISPAYFFKDF